MKQGWALEDSDWNWENYHLIANQENSNPKVMQLLEIDLLHCHLKWPLGFLWWLQHVTVGYAAGIGICHLLGAHTKGLKIMIDKQISRQEEGVGLLGLITSSKIIQVAICSGNLDPFWHHQQAVVMWARPLRRNPNDWKLFPHKENAGGGMEQNAMT